MNNIVCQITMGMPSLPDFWLSVVFSLVMSLFATFMATQFLHMLQLSGYKLKGYFDWLKQSKFSPVGRLLIVSLLSAAAMLITNVLLEDVLVGRALKYTSVIFLVVFSLTYIVNFYSLPQKTSIKYTKRMGRLIGTIAVLTFIISIALMYLSVNCIPYFTAGGVTVIPVLVPFIVVIAHILLRPLEKCISRSYEKKAKQKLSSHKDLISIGVTGSYGKTTVKNIIASILATKYRVCASPFSYNTTLGISRTVLENLNENDQVLISEMGARNPGDISQICEMVKPTIGVITGIGNQHLATFGSTENIAKTKGELVSFVEEVGGTMIFNTDSQKSKEMFENAKCNKFQTNIAGSGDIVAENICCTENGTTFDILIGGKKVENVSTVLLGEHNVSNILIGIQVGLILGISIKEIVGAIKKMPPVSHRLAIVPSNNALVVIDDAYNGSVEGSKSALKVLSNFKGQKVVITPGLVELGREQFNCNFEFGRDMSKVCDYVIITGVVNYEAISSGLEFAGFEKNKIIRAGTLNQAVQMLPSITNPGDVVLFENDLPDNYL